MCKLCNYYPCHPQCPNYELPKTDKYCSVCGEGLYEGDKYVINDDGDLAHLNCFFCAEDLVEWLGLGYTVRVM